MICCGFIVCWTPTAIYNFLMMIDHITDVSNWLYNFIIVISLMNSCINPFIYAAKYREFQAGVRRLLRRHVETPAAHPAQIQMASVTRRQVSAGTLA